MKCDKVLGVFGGTGKEACSLRGLISLWRKGRQTMSSLRRGPDLGAPACNSSARALLSRSSVLSPFLTHLPASLPLLSILSLQWTRLVLRERQVNEKRTSS